MHPSRVVRDKVRQFTDLPNIGPSLARDFVRLGYATPQQLAGVDPLVLYHALCDATGVRQDPCVLDTFMAVAHFLAGGAALPWWHFTPERKRRHGQLRGREA